MKTTRSKTAGGVRSTSSAPNNSGKHSRKAGLQTKRRTRPRGQSKNKGINQPSGHSVETDDASLAHQRPISDRAAKIEEIIQDLSDLREAFAPQVPTSIPAGKRLFVTPEPIWKISAEVRADGRVLLIRHPGMGWLGFIIPHNECERLAKKLTGDLE
jgi:hypothetical protein